MNKKIIAVLGMCGSGKSVACEYFAELKIAGVYFGARTMEELERQGLPVNPENERKVREQLREQHGMAAFAHLSIEKIKAASNLENSHNNFIFIDGLYSFEEYQVLEAAFPKKIIMIEIFTDKTLRYQRLATRTKRSLTPKQAQARDLSEITKLNKGGPIAFSDYKIQNNNSMIELKEKLKNLIQTIQTS